MKLRRLVSILLVLVAGMALCSAYAAAKDDFDPLSADIEQNIAAPPVPHRQAEAVAAAMNALARKLKTEGYAAECVRSGEVVMITVPCSELFAPNSTTLKTDASKRLAGLLPYVKRTDNYKVLIAVHSDNTGDDMYTEQLTADRANALDQYFSAVVSNSDNIIPYGLGADEPVAANTGVANRARNRRVEIYLVPTQLFIDKVKQRQ